MALFVALPSRAADTARQVRDDAGDAITSSPRPCRFVSLAPGTTAMLYAAGAAHCLVGTIAHSTEPAEAAKLPIVGDAETLDFEQLLALRPTVVVVAVDVVQRVRIDRIQRAGYSRVPGACHAARRRCPNRCAGSVHSPARSRLPTARPMRLTPRSQRWARVTAPLADSRALPDLGPAYLHDRRQARDHRRAAACAARSTYSRISRPRRRRSRAKRRCCAIPNSFSPRRRRASADEWLAEWRRFPAMAAVQRQAARELCGRADRSNGPFGDRGDRQSLRGHRQGAHRPGRRRKLKPVPGPA